MIRSGPIARGFRAAGPGIALQLALENPERLGDAATSP
jgi:hypothetical protein